VIRHAVRATGTVTTQHHHPILGARDDDARLYGQPHRATFSVSVELQTFAVDELEPYRLADRLRLWLDDELAVQAGGITCHGAARRLLDQLRVWYGETRGMRVDVTEGDGGATCELPWRAGPGRHPRPIVPE
jgi:hypothetical protein